MWKSDISMEMFSKGWAAEPSCAARALRVRGKVVFSHCSKAAMPGARRARVLLSCLACFQVHCEFSPPPPVTG